MSDAPRFSHAAEEAQHYKAQVKHMQEALREAENGLQEFMESSKELEAELEADIAQTTARADALHAENEALRAVVEEWRGKYQQSLASSRRCASRTTHTRRSCATWSSTTTSSRTPSA